MFSNKIEGDLQSRQHAQPQEVKLNKPRICAVILIPLQNSAPGHARPLHRAYLDNRPIAHHHAPGVDTQVAREAFQVTSQTQNLGRDIDVFWLFTERTPSLK